MPLIYAKVHERREADGRVSSVLALCDADLLGKVFKQGDIELDLKKYESFYKGEAVDEKEAAELVRCAGNANVVGEKSVAAAEKALGSKTGVRRVAGVPQLQIYCV
ncbi:MAG: DUF424 family protein [Candidatus Micrarchaeota archaeon]|nr:DUF424 family protein [Candidatus Micrarchaeota archaeon]